MYNFGTIVLIPFPFTDLSSSKVRPALIVSKENQSEDIVVSFITSGQQNNSKSNFLIQESDAYFQQTGLKTKSIVRYDKIATLSKKIVLGELGKIPKKILKQHKEIFYKNFGF